MRKTCTLLSVFFAAFLCFVFTPVKTNATIHTIQVADNFFNPATQNATVGDTILFQWVGPVRPHTATSTSVPGGAAAFDEQINSGSQTYSYVLTAIGTYDYECLFHAPGMAGTINVTAGAAYDIWAGTFGGGDGMSWSDPLNWLDGSVPTAADSVLLDNSQYPFTYFVNLPTGAVNTVIRKIVIQPADNSYIYLNLTSGNTNNPGFTVGDSVSGNYDFILYKRSIFTNSSGASAGTGISIPNAADSVQLLDSALWIHNCTRGTSGIVQKFSKASNTRTGIFRYDVPTLSSFSITASGITYGSLQFYGLAAGGGLLSKKYLHSGGSQLTVRGDLYIEEHAVDSSAMTINMWNIGGDVTINGRLAFSNTALGLHLNGTTMQTITTTNQGALISKGITFNNSSGFNFVTPTYVDTVVMISGNINSNSGAWLGVGYDATNPGTLIRTAGIVTGQMERWYLSGTVSDSLDFPVGTSSVLKNAKVRFSTPPSTSGRIGIRFIDNGTDGSDLPVALDDGGFMVSRRSDSYWLMSGTFLTGGGIDVAFDGNGQVGITNSDLLRVVWSNDGSTFSLAGNHKMGNASIGRRTNIGTYFSRFYLAGNSTNNPLPVELDNFVATTIKNEVILDWATGHELNNTGFEVQRANLTENSSEIDISLSSVYETVGFVRSQGNSNINQSYKFNDKNLQPGKYAYRLKQIDINGNHSYFLLNNEIFVNLPGKFFISQNYPNPFNPATSINYEMPFDGTMSLIVYDYLGREIRTLANGNITAGYYKAEFNASSLPSGVYFYRVNAITGSQKFEKVFKMILVK
jgi:plastocyanin